MTSRRARAAFAGALALAIALTLGVVHPVRHSDASTVSPAAWTEVPWPFLMDQWGKGTAFRCKAADCGAEIVLYLRPKIGFCNCATGVSDDAELERVADVSLLDDRYAALAPGRAIKVGHMEGRSRAYVVERAARDKVLAIAFNQRCDVIVATAVIAHAQPAAFEPAVLAFLNGDTVLRWAALKLGL